MVLDRIKMTGDAAWMFFAFVAYEVVMRYDSADEIRFPALCKSGRPVSRLLIEMIIIDATDTLQRKRLVVTLLFAVVRLFGSNLRLRPKNLG